MVTPRYQLVIANKTISSWSLRPWLALKWLGVAFDEIAVDLRAPDRRRQIAAHSPSGKVPALNADGLLIWDSLAILEHLAEDHPPLWPRDRAARAVARSVSAEMHSGFQALREHCPFNVLARTPKLDFPAPVAADISRIVACWRDCRLRFGAAGPFLFGHFTAADAMYAPVVSRFRTYVPDLGCFGDDGPGQAYVDAVSTMPEMAAWVEAARAEPTG